MLLLSAVTIPLCNSNCSNCNLLLCPNNNLTPTTTTTTTTTTSTSTLRHTPLSLLTTNASSSSSLANGSSEHHSLHNHNHNPNPNPSPLRHVCLDESEEGGGGGGEAMVSSASAVASVIRKASTSPVEFVQRIDKDGKKKGLTLPSPDFQILSLEQLDLFRRIVHPDALLSIWVPSNPRGAEILPPAIVAAESDFYLRRLWGVPSEDLTIKQKYLVTFTVGYDQRHNIDAAVKKFSENFTILLFHYDGRTTEWNEFEWSKRAIHVSALKQTKWWYAKRFLYPDIVAPYDYIFIWDEDLGVEHFNAEEYIKLVRKHGLEISQPGLEPDWGLTWQMTKRRGDREAHKEPEEKPSWCADSNSPPCAAFVEIMAPVFSRDAWRCVWHLIQNDLVHGWGLDFALQKCVEPAHEKIGVIDAQWIVHQTVPSLGNQGEAENGKAPWQGVRERCRREWTMFQNRVANAEKAYYTSMGIDPLNSTAR